MSFWNDEETPMHKKIRSKFSIVMRNMLDYFSKTGLNTFTTTFYWNYSKYIVKFIGYYRIVLIRDDGDIDRGCDGEPGCEFITLWKHIDGVYDWTFHAVDHMKFEENWDVGFLRICCQPMLGLIRNHVKIKHELDKKLK